MMINTKHSIFLVPLMSEPSFAGGLDDLNGLSDGWTVLVALFLFFFLQRNESSSVCGVRGDTDGTALL